MWIHSAAKAVLGSHVPGPVLGSRDAGLMKEIRPCSPGAYSLERGQQQEQIIITVTRIRTSLVVQWLSTFIWAIVLISAKAKTQSVSTGSGKTLPFSAPLKSQDYSQLGARHSLPVPSQLSRGSLLMSHCLTQFSLFIYWCTLSSVHRHFKQQQTGH